MHVPEVSSQLPDAKLHLICRKRISSGTKEDRHKRFSRPDEGLRIHLPATSGKMASPRIVGSRPAQKGLFDTLPAEAQLIALAGQKLSRVQSPWARSSVPFALRSIFKPSTFILIMMTVALITWGYGDRLTRYKNSSDPLKRTLVARFWVDQQTNLRDVAAKLHTPPHSIFDIFLPVEAPQPVSHRFIETILAAPRVQCAVALIHPLLPLRSPPSVSFQA